MATKPRKKPAAAPKRASARKPRVAKAPAVKQFVQRSVDDFTHTISTADLVAKLGNIDVDMLDDEDRIYAIGSLQVEASYNYHNGVSVTDISKRELAILLTCQKKARAEV